MIKTRLWLQKTGSLWRNEVTAGYHLRAGGSSFIPRPQRTPLVSGSG
jgi:hypothetical protein